MKNIKWMKRKEFDSLFATKNAEGKNKFTTAIIFKKPDANDF